MLCVSRLLPHPIRRLEKKMTYATVASGIETPSVAWDGLGWKPIFFAQFDPEHDYSRGPDFPSKVLAHHYPNVHNLGDMNLIDGKKYRNTIDVLCGGTPCQSFSIAGLRAGLADPGGNLALKFLGLADEIRPPWIVWENVPGVLSSWSDVEGSPQVERIGPENGQSVQQTYLFQSKASSTQSMNPGPISPCLDKVKSDGLAVHSDIGIRRLTPLEYERLQGFPDGYTDILKHTKKGTPDKPRYESVGNAMAEPVIRWLGGRIQKVHNIIIKQNGIIRTI